MMIDKRLIRTVPDSKRYIMANVAMQWCALAANIAMMAAFCRLLERLYLGRCATADLALTAVVALAAVAVRFGCHLGTSRMSFLSSRSVKRTLRQTIYEKLLRLGAAYRDQVRSSEVVQVAVEGVDQLETYFGAYLPQFFCHPRRQHHRHCGTQRQRQIHTAQAAHAFLADPAGQHHNLGSAHR